MRIFELNRLKNHIGTSALDGVAISRTWNARLILRTTL